MTSNYTVAICHTQAEAEVAVKDLQKAGFDVKHLSIVGKDYHVDETVTGYYTTGERMKYWGKTGAFWGGIWGLLVGSAVFLIPGIGPVMMAGPIVGLVLGLLEGSVVGGGVGLLGAGLYSLGLPKEKVIECEVAIKAGKFLVINHGSLDEMIPAMNVLAQADKDSCACKETKTHCCEGEHVTSKV
jgi:hypothetical protein